MIDALAMQAELFGDDVPLDVPSPGRRRGPLHGAVMRYPYMGR